MIFAQFISHGNPASVLPSDRQTLGKFTLREIWSIHLQKGRGLLINTLAGGGQNLDHLFIICVSPLPSRKAQSAGFQGSLPFWHLSDSVLLMACKVARAYAIRPASSYKLMKGFGWFYPMKSIGSDIFSGPAKCMILGISSSF